MSNEDLKAELERLRNENAALKKGASSSVRMKVSEKGAVSIYGMGRFPVTLYKEQWLKLLDMSDEIRAFIAANEAQLKAKDSSGPDHDPASATAVQHRTNWQRDQRAVPQDVPSPQFDQVSLVNSISRPTSFLSAHTCRGVPRTGGLMGGRREEGRHEVGGRG